MENSRSLFQYLVIATVVFCLLTTAVAVNLLMSSSRQIDNAYALDRAVLEASTLAEGLKSSNGDLSFAAELMGLEYFDIHNRKLTIYYDEDMAVSKEKHSTYRAVIRRKIHDLYIVYNIKFFKNSDMAPEQEPKTADAASDNGQDTDASNTETVKPEPLYALRFKCIRGGGIDVEW